MYKAALSMTTNNGKPLGYFSKGKLSTTSTNGILLGNKKTQMKLKRMPLSEVSHNENPVSIYLDIYIYLSI
jgi:hypothetical protein